MKTELANWATVIKRSLAERQVSVKPELKRSTKPRKLSMEKVKLFQLKMSVKASLPSTTTPTLSSKMEELIELVQLDRDSHKFMLNKVATCTRLSFPNSWI